MTDRTRIDLRDLVEAVVSREVEALRYRESHMLAYGLRGLIEKKLEKIPEEIPVEDKRDQAGLKDEYRFCVSSESLSYINDFRTAILLERWCYQVLACSPRDGAKEVSSLWKDPQGFEAALSEINVSQMRDGEARLVGVLQSTAANLDNGDDYLVVLWNWIRAPSRQHPEGKPRLVHVTDRALVENLCQTYLSRELVLPDEMDEVLKMAGLSAVRARLNLKSSKPSSDEALEDLLDPKDAAKLLGINVATLNNKKSRGELPASVYVQPPGKRIKYHRKALLAWFRGQPSERRRRR